MSAPSLSRDVAAYSSTHTFAPNRATSSHSFISISGISSLKDALRFIVSMEKLPGDGSRTTEEQGVHTSLVATSQMKCQLISISVSSGSNNRPQNLLLSFA